MNSIKNRISDQHDKNAILYIDKSRIYAGAEECLNSLMRFLDRDLFQPFLCADFMMEHHKLYDLKDVNVYYRNEKVRWWQKDFWHLPPLGIGHLERCIFSLKLLTILQQTQSKIVHLNLYRKTSYLDLLTAHMANLIVIAHVRSLSTQTEFRRSSLNLCDAVICTSDAVKKGIEKFQLRGLVKRIYDGIDMNKYKYEGTKAEARMLLGLPQAMRLISSVAILDKRKGHDTAIQSLSIILKANPNVMLVIAGGEMEQGSMNETRRLQNMAGESGVLSNVRFLGDCRNMPALYAASDIILALSKDGEAFGRVPVEAAITRRPVIATTMGATPEIIIDDETGFLVKPNDITNIASKALAVLNNPLSYETLLDSAEKRAIELFDSRNCNREIRNLYLELLLQKKYYQRK
jgi:glycosyltransferase involved in cell wall biosynthesis